MNTDQTNDKPIVLRCNEDGLWEKYEPYMTIDCPTEEDYNFIVRALEHYKQSEWISVEERLPDGNGRFLTVDKKGDMMVCYWEKRFGWFASVCNKNAITHWMPLPKPPKGD